MGDEPIIREPDESVGWNNGVASPLLPGLGQPAAVGAVWWARASGADSPPEARAAPATSSD